MLRQQIFSLLLITLVANIDGKDHQCLNCGALNKRATPAFFDANFVFKSNGSKVSDHWQQTPVKYTFFDKVALEIRFKFTPFCSKPETLRIFQKPFSGNLATREWTTQNKTVRFERETQHFVITQATFSEAGEYTALCLADQISYNDGKPLPVYVKVEPQVLFVDVVDWEFREVIDAKEYLRKLYPNTSISSFFKADRDQKKIDNATLVVLQNLEMLERDLTQLNRFPKSVTADFSKNAGVLKVIRFHVGNGFLDCNNVKSPKFTAMWNSTTIKNKAEAELDFQVKNAPNGRTYIHKIDMASILRDQRNICDWKYETKIDGGPEEMISLKLIYAPYKINATLRNLESGGRCEVNVTYQSSCPNEFEKADLVIEDRSDSNGKTASSPYVNHYSMLKNGTELKPVVLSGDVCHHLSLRSPNFTLKTSFLPRGLLDPNAVPYTSIPDNNSLIIVGQYTGFKAIGLKPYIIVIIVLICVLAGFAVGGFICFMILRKNAKNPQSTAVASRDKRKNDLKRQCVTGGTANKAYAGSGTEHHHQSSSSNADAVAFSMTNNNQSTAVFRPIQPAEQTRVPSAHSADPDFGRDYVERRRQLERMSSSASTLHLIPKTGNAINTCAPPASSSLNNQQLMPPPVPNVPVPFIPVQLSYKNSAIEGVYLARPVTPASSPINNQPITGTINNKSHEEAVV